MSAPTNVEARRISAEIRMRRRALGEIGSDEVQIEAVDPTGAQFEFPLARGDRVRLYARTNAKMEDGSRGTLLGNNGTVLTVVDIDARGVLLRNPHGREGRASWDTLRDRRSGRILLAYGDVLTIDSVQGITSTEHIEAFPTGTRGIDARRAYVSGSRHRRTTYSIFSDGAERRDLATRRMLGESRLIYEADVWANVARNLSRSPEETSATALLKMARQGSRSAAHELREGLHAMEDRAARGLAPTTIRPKLLRLHLTSELARVGEDVIALLREQAGVLDKVRSFLKRLTKPTRAKPRRRMSARHDPALER